MIVLQLDEIGYWSEIKLDIARKYAQAYSNVLANQRHISGYLYIDAFAGAGVHISKQTGEFVSGSPLVQSPQLVPSLSYCHSTWKSIRWVNR